MQPQLPDEIKQLADKWLQGTITVEERAVLDAWYQQQPADEVVWESGDSDEAGMEARLYADIANKLQPAKTYHIKQWVRAAAVLALILTGWWSKHIYEEKYSTVIVSNTRGIKKMFLPDSSIVWLKGNSSLTFTRSFGKKNRVVQLQGEGLFEIAKDPAHPFIVNTGAYTTRVLGTSFNIKEETSKSAFELLVLTGKVQIEKKNNSDKQHPLLVTPDYQFMSSDQQTPVLSKASNATRAATMTGTEYDMNFNRTPFPEIMQRVENKFDVKFAGSYAAFEQCKVTADITDQSLSNSLKLLTMAVNANYHLNNGIITVTGSGCK
ncbi:FecR family protein [Chitinophaga niastensis]|uniref:FecR family protein n=1 Tax=Chitinophaga niastensis TaxID=536980 RepID=A0A2P8HNN4_CHINA|nr:FecR family protein [Chitinophaga niastensis]PSL47829.1 FecR family protein [Chitinophaga niastensis]